MCDVMLSRRQLLRYGALVAATFPAAHLLRPEWALAEHAASTGPAAPIHLELVTVSDTRAVVTWFTGDPTNLDGFGRPHPVKASGRVLIGTSPDPRTWTEVREPGDPTPYHLVEITGLSPGTTYYWRAESNGLVATQTVVNQDDPSDVAAPPAFITLVPPPGRELGTIAWLNDLHFGEQVAGLAISVPGAPGGGIPPGFPVDPANPYWRFMSEAAVGESRMRGATLLLANGDLTNEAEPDALASCRRTLDAFGVIATGRSLAPDAAPTYFVTRGNHDRAHAGELYQHCSPKAGTANLRDCFADTFAASYDPGTTHFSVSIGDDRARFRFVGLDSNDDRGLGILPKGELEYFEQEVSRGDATIPLFHHPASDLASLTQAPPGIFGVRPDDALAFRQIIARHPNVAGVYAGHTHRNQRSLASLTGSVPFFEGGAVKEYPGGYTTVRLFEGGYLVNFWKTSSPDARAWSERSRGEYLGQQPNYALGGLRDRNWVHAFDARRSAPVAGASGGGEPRAATARTPAGGSHPATGGDGPGLALGGAAVVTAAAAAGVARCTRASDRPQIAEPTS